MRLSRMFGTALMALTSAFAFADPVTYTVTTDSAYGDFNFVGFHDVPLTESLTVDTSTIQADPALPDAYMSAPGIATITIGDVGTSSFTGAVRMGCIPTKKL